MQPPSSTHLVFVDFENVPAIDLGAIEGKSARVTLLIGKNQKKLDLDLVRQIHRLAPQVDLVEVGASGHNALDLTLAYYLGQTAAEHPTAQFHIVSKDKDFDPLIGHLHARKIKITRHESFAALPFLPPPPKVAGIAKNSPEDRRAKIFARLTDPTTKNRPSTLKRLLADLKANFGPDATDAMAEAALRELIAGNALHLDAQNRVRYSPV